MKPAPTPALRDLVLVGGGHANVQVLKRFAMRPVPGLRITLISVDTFTPYSGMLPGAIAGTYGHDDILINLRGLCRFAGARLIHGAVTALNVQARTLEIELASGVARPPLPFDVLSINCGAVPSAPVDGEVMVKPIAEFLPKWERILHTIADGDTLTVIGGGAGGVELALAVRARLNRAGRQTAQVQLLGSKLLPGHNARVRELVLQELHNARIDWHDGRATGLVPGALLLENDNSLASTHALWVTDVKAPDWIRASGLSVDDDGFLRVDRHLRSLDAEAIFGAGDAVALEGQARPKSGVYAVRAGPYLAHNIRAQLFGRRPRPFRAQQEHLALIGIGDGRAIASRGDRGFVGRRWWQMKDLIDRRFMAKFNDLPLEMSAAREIQQQTRQVFSRGVMPNDWRDEIPDHDMRCGGCGAKLAADPLRRVLSRLSVPADERVQLGIGDDAAAVLHQGPTLLSVDGFRAMVDDPYLFGRIATHHALNDIYAMGAQPVSALSFVTLPFMSERMMEEELYALLSGVSEVLAADGVALVGGHSAEGAELSVALTVTGEQNGVAIEKRGARAGDALLLTKPLGTGAILAAEMIGANASGVAQAVHRGMDQSNREGVHILQRFDLHALTDVTGFGLAGHLGEILHASSCGVRLQLERLPCYPGAHHAIETHPSSLQAANELALQDFVLQDGLRPDDARLRLLFDPQTSGGMLASLPAAQAEDALVAIRSAGYAAAVIGEITTEGWHISAQGEASS